MDYRALIERVYEHIENDHVEKAVFVCLRLARNLNDYLNAAIFLRELYPDKHQLRSVFREDTNGLKDEAVKYVWEKSNEAWLAGRKLPYALDGDDDVDEGEKRNLLPAGVAEIDANIEQWEKAIQDLAIPAGMGKFDTAAFTDRHNSQKAELRVRINAEKVVRSRVKTRCTNYAISLERQLQAQQKTQSFLHKVQTEVNNYFKGRSEDVYLKLQKAANLTDSDDPENYSLLLTQVRRSLKAVADHFYPPAAQPVTCSDGNERALGDDKYLNRLHEFLSKTFPSGSSTDLLLAELEVLIAFVRKLNDISSKGVHASVSGEEAKQGLLGLYLFSYNVISRLQKRDHRETPSK
jgi:hypothetical protein